MGHLLGFHILIGPGADPSNKNKAIQQDQVPFGTWRENWSADVEFKQKPNDLINSIAIEWNSPIGTDNMGVNMVDDALSQRNRRRQNIGNEFEHPLPFQPYSSPSMVMTNDGSTDPPSDFCDNLSCFKRLWVELRTIEHWDIFMAVGAMETMHQTAEIVQHNVSPSEANVIQHLIQSLSSRLTTLILGINSHGDCTAVENAFSYNWSLNRFKQQIDVLAEGVVKQATQTLTLIF